MRAREGKVRAREGMLSWLEGNVRAREGNVRAREGMLSWLEGNVRAREGNVRAREHSGCSYDTTW